MKTTLASPAKTWEEVPLLIDARPAEKEYVAYGISQSLCGKELYIDFGDELGAISLVKIKFRSDADARNAYCKGIRLALKVVEHPEH